MILFLDNYDSFTYNLYQYIGELYPDIQVVRNDEITLEEIEAMHPDALLISPGAGLSERCWYLDSSNSEVCRKDADSGHLLGTSGNCRGIRRKSCQGRTPHARQSKQHCN